MGGGRADGDYRHFARGQLNCEGEGVEEGREGGGGVVQVHV